MSSLKEPRPGKVQTKDVDMNTFIETLSNALKTNDTTTALSISKEKCNIRKLQENPWDILPIITGYINHTTLNENKELFTCCTNLLSTAVEKCFPDDVLLLLLTDIENAKDDTMFIELIYPLQTVLLRVPKKRLKYLSWALNSLQTYYRKLPEPEECDLEENHKLLMDADEDVDRISYLYQEMIPFYAPVINNYLSEPCAKSRRILTKFLIQILGKPLMYLDMTADELCSKPRARRVAEEITLQVMRVCHDPFLLLALNSSTTSYTTSDKNDNELAIGTFFYLVLHHHVGIQYTPRVYTHFHIFQNSLYLVVIMLSQQSQFIIEKGLCLAEAITQNLRDTVLSYLLLQCVVHSQFCRSIAILIIYGTQESYRKKALVIFTKYLCSFDDTGRCIIISNLVQVLDFAGYFKSFLITQYKQMMVQALDKDPPIHPYFCGRKLLRLLLLFCHLEKGEKTDLIDASDQIVGSLNLLRYLILRDKDNVTSIHDHVKVLEHAYLIPLRDALILSRAHYKRQVQHLHEGHGDAVNGEKFNVTVGSDVLPAISDNEKLQVLNFSLTAFDVIDSLLSRVMELIDANKACRVSRATCSTQSSNTSSQDTSTANTNTDTQYEDEIRTRILAASLPHVPQMGWSKEALSAGAEAVGYPGITHGMFRKGGADLIDYYQKSSNQKLVEFMNKKLSGPSNELAPALFVESSVQERLRMLIPYLHKWPQAIAIMTLPPNVPTALATLLTMVDDICYYAGDRSVDFNWYARRIALAGVYKTTELYMIQDSSADYEKTWKFLNRRLTEAIQIHDALLKSDFSGLVTTDKVTSVFTTARNILGLNHYS